MKVKELIEQLQSLDPEAIVVMSSDGEGNSYSPLSDFAEGFYLPNTTWSGEFTSKGSVEEYPDTYLIDSEEYQKAISFFPIN